MASINDLAAAATVASALTPATAPVPGLATDPTPAAPISVATDPTVTRGALIVLEGLDRSGKTTQVKLLEQRFVELGKKVKLMRFPGRFLFGSV
jgi:dTMP kinase